MKLEKPLLFFDIEATGLNVTSDRIVELSYIVVHPDGREEVTTERFNPGIPISAEASAVNGIKDEDVKDCPRFKERAQDLADLFAQCDIAGFNSDRFDVPMLVEEFIRAGVDFNPEACRFIDVMGIYHKMEKRDLSAACKFYLGRDLKDAHTAEADTLATKDIFFAQLERYKDTLKEDVDFLASFSRRQNNVDLAGRIVRDEQGNEVINFGKHKGRKVVDVLRSEPSYFSWIMRGDFAQNTKQAFMRIKLREGI